MIHSCEVVIGAPQDLLEQTVTWRQRLLDLVNHGKGFEFTSGVITHKDYEICEQLFFQGLAVFSPKAAQRVTVIKVYGNVEILRTNSAWHAIFLADFEVIPEQLADKALGA